MYGFCYHFNILFDFKFEFITCENNKHVEKGKTRPF
jgi:hypothetical protein